MKRLALILSLGLPAFYACSDDEPVGGSPGKGGSSGTSGKGGSSGKGGTSGASSGGSSGASGKGGSSGTSGQGGSSGDSGGSSAASGRGGSSGAGGRGGSSGTSGQGGGAGAGDAGEPGTGGTSGNDGGNGGEGGEGVLNGVSITPTEGGKVMIDGATLAVGPGAVNTTTIVTASSSAATTGLPRASELRGLVYTFGPDGLVFDEPVLIMLPSAGSPPLGKQRAVAWLDETANKWIPLPTVVTNGRALAGTTHFSKYTVLEWNRADVGDCTFPAPCGGALATHYDVGGSCFTGTLPPNGSVEACPSSSFTQSLLLTSGIMDFGPSDAVFRSSTVARFARMILQPACLTTVSGLFSTTISTCRDLEGSFAVMQGVPLACDGNVAQSCTCYAPIIETSSVESGTFTAAGTTLTITSTMGTTTSSYCVQGGNVYVTDASDFDYLYLP